MSNFLDLVISSVSHIHELSLKSKSSAKTSTAQNKQEPQFRPQAKLKLGNSNDVYEKEANQVADHVVQPTLNQSGEPAFFQPNPILQRLSQVQAQRREKAAEEESKDSEMGTESDLLQLQPQSEIAPKVQATGGGNSDDNDDIQKKDDQNNSGGADSIESDLSASKGGGSPLDDNTKNQMESGIGSDFSNVRVHTNSKAQDMNQKIGAQAFTNGSDIYFNQGKYNPGSKDGKHLLAHELTHTVQQGASGDMVHRKEEEEIVTIEDEPKQVATFSVTAPHDIAEGDPKFTIMRLLFAAVLGLDSDHHRIGRVHNQFVWKPSFETMNHNKTRKFGVSNDVYLKALLIAYGEEGFNSALFDFTDDMSIYTEPFTSEQRFWLRTAAEQYGKMTNVDRNYYDIWLDKKGAALSGVRSTEVTLESLPMHVAYLQLFLSDKLNNLQSIYRIATFTKKKNVERSNKLEHLKNRINEIPDYLLDRLLKETGIGMGETIQSSWYTYFLPPGIGIPIAAKNTVEDEKERLNKIDEAFQKKGFSINEVFDFISLFREIAVGEAFTMLEENYHLLSFEHKRYSKWSKFIELYEFLQTNYTPKFREADQLRAQASLGLIKHYKSLGIPASAGGDIAKNLYGYRNDLKKATWYVARIKPNELISSLAQILKAYEFSQKSIQDHVIENIEGFKNPRLMITGDTSNAKYYMQVLRMDDRFKRADEKDMETSRDLQSKGAQDYPVLADLSFDFRRMTAIPKTKFKKEILTQLETKKKNNKEITKDLKNDPDTVWKLELLIQKVRNDYGISEDSIPGKIINDIYKDKADAEFWKNIGLGALGIVLGIAGFFTGGATWATLAVIAGGVLVSGYVLYEEIERYQFEDAAGDIGLDAANELSEKNPSMLGIVLAVLGLLLDAGALFKGITVFKAASKATKSLDKIAGGGYKYLEIKNIQKSFDDLLTSRKPLKNLDKHAKKIYEAIGPKRLKGISLEDFTQELRTILKEQARFKKGIKILFGHLKVPKELQATLSDGLLSIGVQRMYKTDRQAFERILKEFGNNPNVILQLSVESTFNPNFASTFSRLSGKLKNTKNFKQAVTYIHNNRGTVLENLDKTLDVINKSKIYSEDLALRIIESPKLQNVVRKLDDPTDVKTIWSKYWTEQPKSSFSEFAASQITSVNKINSLNKLISKLKSNSDLIKHLFKGDLRKVTGCHYRKAVDGIDIRFVDDAIPEANSLGVLKGNIEMRKPLFNSQGDITGYSWKLKVTRDGPQTFFPQTWSKDKIIEECASALTNPNKSLVPGKTRMFTAESNSGVFMKWFEDGAGNVTSIFPEFY